LSGERLPYERLSVVIPAFNEAEAIGKTLEQILAATPGAEILVVDDFSRDRTCEIATAFAGVRVIRHSFNRGQGASLKTGMRAATRPYVAWFDADNEHKTGDLERLFKRMLDDRLVAVIAQRTNGSTSTVRALGKWMIRLIGRGMQIKAGSDLNCGLRIFRRPVILRYLALIPDRFSSSLVTTLVMLERRYPLAFVPITTSPRIGVSTVRLKDGFEAILQLLRAILLFAPMRIFLPVGLWTIGAGLLYSAVVALFAGRGVPVGGMLLVLAGLMTMILGLLADQISQMRLGQFDGDIGAVLDDLDDEGPLPR